ncbi:cysteine--tRNA ligase [Candidatus Roizmanbacteria bacterium]|nr:cysteine--tRNA ligase [Candidatus Roizmanbacteria bacterium]
MHIFNSRSRKKEVFRPLGNKKVKLYVCGITPYDTTHLGHAFVYVFFDTFVRYLRLLRYDVTYTQNVTDIDDDILKRAREEGEDWKKLGDYWTKQFLLDMKALNVAMPTHYVYATASTATIIRIIVAVLKRGYAYERNDNVYFEIKKFKDYGKLSRLTRSQMLVLSKERGADPKDPLKKNPLDFVLWQRAKKGEPGWESPWGRGRPGWHIECSAMNLQYLGRQVDIHGGGRDLIYPHHESEIAQSESYTGKSPFVRYWVHTAMLIYEGEKMSKSLGNLILVKDLLKKYSGGAIRWMLLSHHYRVPWEFEYHKLDEAERTIDEITRALGGHKTINKVKKQHLKHICNILNDDMNTPRALSYIKGLSGRATHDKRSAVVLRKCLQILGFVFPT